MMVAWAGMASGGYVGGALFDLSLSYTPSFVLAGIGGILNLAVISAFAAMKNPAAAKLDGKQKQTVAYASPLILSRDQCEQGVSAAQVRLRQSEARLSLAST
jgi:hypothetical protein